MAAKTPSASPKARLTTVEMPIKTRVLGVRSAIISSTGRPVKSELPRSPVKAEPSHFRYWT
ncbi:hypothetical protein D3C86_1430980 [compost metagenome]